MAKATTPKSTTSKAKSSKPKGAKPAKKNGKAQKNGAAKGTNAVPAAPLEKVSAIDVREIALSDIYLEEGFNARSDLGNDSDHTPTKEEFNALVSSISGMGVQVPVGVQKLARKKGGCQYALLYGFRRHAASISADKDTIPARIYSSDLSRGQALLLNLQENIARRSLNPMDESDAAARLLKSGGKNGGMTEEEVRATLGWSKTLLTQRLAQAKYAKPIRDALRVNRITVRQATAIHKADVSPAKTQELVKKASFQTLGALQAEIVKLQTAGMHLDTPQALDAADAPADAPADPGLEGEAPFEPLGEAPTPPTPSSDDKHPLCLGIQTSLEAISRYTWHDHPEEHVDTVRQFKTISWESLNVRELESLSVVFSNMANALNMEGETEG